MKNMKVVTIDIETSPNIAAVWGYWKQNVNKDMVMQRPTVLAYAAKTLGKPGIRYVDTRKDPWNDKAISKKLIKELDSADVLIAHNGNKFDFPRMQGRAALNGLLPPSPYRTIDTLLVARKAFGLGDNSLATLTKLFKLDTVKSSHAKFPGYKLWEGCLQGNLEAWEEMKAYNIIDVVSLELLYLKLRPWIKNHPNMGVYGDSDERKCVACGSTNVVKRGTYKTNLSIFQQYRCKDCGKWSRGRTNLMPKSRRENLITNAM